MMEGMRIPVQGTFDVALARNLLRKRVAEKGWQPAYRARASAALTALTELILLSQAPAVLDIDLVEERVKAGVRLVCEIHWRAAKGVLLEQARVQLSRAADELQIEDRPSMTRVVASVWIKEGEQ